MQAGEAPKGGAAPSVGGTARPELPGDRTVRVLDHLRGLQLSYHEPRRWWQR